jgi:hypothetical protein
MVTRQQLYYCARAPLLLTESLYAKIGAKIDILEIILVSNIDLIRKNDMLWMSS